MYMLLDEQVLQLYPQPVQVYVLESYKKPSMQDRHTP
jgi:hypothetical protein